ncbi:hypothetical protein FM119_11660 [Mycetocola reblochoni REB411]|uniref:Uncharacterized protein n=1 Tax=Mycetocola reblochoni REB411 TaxID=1255698 RepID=A0A1R4K6A2_9MICO|nr:hypothetical protein FM119_11660 [Mycetocola reblochoni REB411]
MLGGIVRAHDRPVYSGPGRRPARHPRTAATARGAFALSETRRPGEGFHGPACLHGCTRDDSGPQLGGPSHVTARE